MLQFRVRDGDNDIGGVDMKYWIHKPSTTCATYLMRLKSFVETGKGAPNPYDTKIANWN